MAKSAVYIYGKHSVQAYLAGQNVQRLYYASDDNKASLLAVSQLNPEILEKKTYAELSQIVSGGNHQGLVAEVESYRALNESALEPWLNACGDSTCCVVLDQVQDPHNLGACIRTAAVAGVSAVIIPKDRAVGITPAVAKVASGALGLVPVIQVTNLARQMKWLKNNGFWLYGADEVGESTLYEQTLTGKVAWVMGSEGKGLRSLTKTNCDVICSIPSSDQLSCLNVSVATGVCLFETLRQNLLLSQNA